MMAVAMWMAVELAVAITLMFAMAMVMVMKKGMAPTMAIFSLNAQAGGQVVELGGVPDGPAALNIVPDGHLAGPAALVAWASCLEHRDQHLQKLRGH